MSNLEDPIPEGRHSIHGQGVSGYGIPIHDVAGEVGQWCIVLGSTNDRLDDDTVVVHSEVVAPIYVHKSIHNLVQ